MDHLPWRYTDRPRPVIPNICNHLEESDLCPDFESFLTWPDAQGWNVGSDTELFSLARYCQEWLFLGLAKIIAQKHRLLVSILNLIPPETSDILDTRGITKRLLHLKWSQEQSEDISQVLDFAQMRMLEWFDLIDRDSKRWTEGAFNVCWSTALFHEWIRSKLKHKYRNSLHGTEVAKYINSQIFITDRLRLGGRCPTVLRRKRFSLLDTWTLLSVPLLKSFEIDQALLHEECIDRDCKAFHIDKDNYQMQHAPCCAPDTHCKLRGTSAELLCSKIDNGVFPVIRSTVDHTSLHIDVVDGDQVEHFTAISHVWAGGLGNFKDNTTYECQLERLHRALSPTKTLRSTVFYWLDTLCVPVGNEVIRKKAIDDMARIYASAQDVYVLDPVLQHLEVNKLPYREQAILIAASPWSARSWTFQESALAVRMNFQFHDAVAGSNEIDPIDSGIASGQLQMLWRQEVDRLEGGDLSNFASPKFWFTNIYACLVWARLVPPRFRSSRLLQKSKGVHIPKQATPEENLLLVWQELSQRNSKEIQDVAAIIAVFIGRSAKEVLDLSSQERTHALIWSLESLPIPLLFAPTNPDAVGWSPMLPTCSVHTDELKSNASLKFSKEGLIELSEQREVYLLHLEQPLCLEGMHTLPLNDSKFDGRVQVNFSKPTSFKGKQISGTECSLILVLPRWLLDQELGRLTNCDHPGICIQYRNGDFAINRHAVYKATFRWRVLKLQQSTSWNDISLMSPVQDPDDCLPSPSEDENLTRQPDHATERTAAKSQVSMSRETSSPILLDMNIGQRKPLKWSRHTFYPFEGHSVETAKPIFVIMGLKLVAVVLGSSRIVLGLGMWLLGSILGGSFMELAIFVGPHVFIIFVLVVFRTVVGELEESQLRNALRSPLQRKWASSFKPTERNDGEAHTTGYLSLRKIQLLLSLYCLLSILAITLLPMHIRYFSRRLGHRSVQEESHGLFFLAVLATVFEVCMGFVDFGRKSKSGDVKTFMTESAMVFPYLWLCLELILRDGYIARILIEKCYQWHGLNIGQSNDRRVSPLRNGDSSRSIWIKICIYTTLACVLVPFGISETVGIIELSNTKGPDRAGGIVIAVQTFSTVLFLGPGCMAAFAAYRLLRKAKSVRVANGQDRESLENGEALQSYSDAQVEEHSG